MLTNEILNDFFERCCRIWRGDMANPTGTQACFVVLTRITVKHSQVSRDICYLHILNQYRDRSNRYTILHWKSDVTVSHSRRNEQGVRVLSVQTLYSQTYQWVAWRCSGRIINWLSRCVFVKRGIGLQVWWTVWSLHGVLVGRSHLVYRLLWQPCAWAAVWALPPCENSSAHLLNILNHSYVASWGAVPFYQ